jgi:hypothetical protein
MTLGDVFARPLADVLINIHITNSHAGGEPSWQSTVTAVAAVIGAIAVIFFFLQAHEATRARTLESTTALLHILDNPDVRQIREAVFAPGFRERLAAVLAGSGSDPDSIDQSLQRLGPEWRWRTTHSYLASLEHISMLILHDCAPDGIVEMYFGRLLPHQWNVFCPLILKHREWYRNEDFLQHWEKAAEFLGGDYRKYLPRRWWMLRRKWRFGRERLRLLAQLRKRQADERAKSLRESAAAAQAPPSEAGA